MQVHSFVLFLAMQRTSAACLTARLLILEARVSATPPATVTAAGAVAESFAARGRATVSANAVVYHHVQSATAALAPGSRSRSRSSERSESPKPAVARSVSGSPAQSRTTFQSSAHSAVEAAGEGDCSMEPPLEGVWGSSGVNLPDGDAGLATRSLPAPRHTLELEHVYGCSVRLESQMENQMSVVGLSQVAFAAAAVGVVLDVSTGQQRVYCGHSCRVTCIVAHEAFGPVASSQDETPGRHPCQVCIWRHCDSASSSGADCAELARLPVEERRVDALGWSADGRLLFVMATPAADVESGRQEHVYVWEIAAPESPLLKVRASRERVRGILSIGHESRDITRFAAYGVGHLCFFEYARGQNRLTPCMASWGPGVTAPKAVLCASHVPPCIGSCVAAIAKQQRIVVGTSEGRVALFVGSRLSATVAVAAGAITFLRSSPWGFCCGCSDRILRVLDTSSLQVSSTCVLGSGLDSEEDGLPLDAVCLPGVNAPVGGGARTCGAMVVATASSELWLCAPPSHPHGVSHGKQGQWHAVHLAHGAQRGVSAVATNPAHLDEAAMGDHCGTIGFLNVLERRLGVRQAYQAPMSCGGVTPALLSSLAVVSF